MSFKTSSSNYGAKISDNGGSGSFVPIKEGETTIFYQNTSGFPLDCHAVTQMFDFAQELQPSAAIKMQTIQEQSLETDTLPQVEYPMPPIAFLQSKKNSCDHKFDRIQSYIHQLQYNHTGMQFFEIRKDRALIGLAEVSRRIIDESLPIKCLEAVILGIFLLNEIPTSYNLITKFTIGFKTRSNSNTHRHVVLGVYYPVKGLFGAIGLSRRSNLGHKPLEHLTLSSLIQDYIDSYEVYMHKVKRIKIGKPIVDSNRSFESIGWVGVNVTINSSTQSEWPKQVEKHSRIIRHHFTDKLNMNGGQNETAGVNTSLASYLKQATSLSLRNLTNNNNSDTSSSSLLSKSSNNNNNNNTLRPAKSFMHLTTTKTSRSFSTLSLSSPAKPASQAKQQTAQQQQPKDDSIAVGDVGGDGEGYDDEDELEETIGSSIVANSQVTTTTTTTTTSITTRKLSASNNNNKGLKTSSSSSSFPNVKRQQSSQPIVKSAGKKELSSPLLVMPPLTTKTIDSINDQDDHNDNLIPIKKKSLRV